MASILNILISTFDDSIYNVNNVLLDYREDVTYIISHQFTDEKFKIIPKDLIRNDVIVSHIYGKGVTKSRNNAIRLADGTIGLFSDDDVTYNHNYFDRIIRVFEENKDLDIALFKINTPEGFPEYKNYPNQETKLKKLPFSVGTIEIAFKINRIKHSKIYFDERFGAGQPLLIGSDENIFVLDCIKFGLNVWFFSEYIVNHPYESSVKSLSKYDKRRVSVGGAFDARINGIIAIPKAVFGTLKILPDLIRHNKNPLIYLKERLLSAVFILNTNGK